MPEHSLRTGRAGGHGAHRGVLNPLRADVKLDDELHRDYRPSLRCDELEAMLIYSMSVSVDGFITDREGAFGFTVPTDEQFRFHIEQTRELGLVDELRMFRNPVVVGSGTPFLPPVIEDVPLDLVETRTFGPRVIYERYRRARGESD